MWIMTGFGVLMPAIRPPKTIAPGDNRTLQIRARRAKDLDILRAQYMPGKLGPNIHSPDKDYEYRAYCVPADFALATVQMVMDIDYLKFKPTCYRYQDDELHRVYNSIWATVLAGLSTQKHQDEYWGKWEKKPGTTGTGYPKAVGAGTVIGPTRPVETVADWSWDEEVRLQKWLADHPNGHRDTSADRDEYLPDVGADDYPPLTTKLSDTASAKVESLYNEIDALLDLQKSTPVDHSKCEHNNTKGAKAVCRAKHRAATENRIEEIRLEIEQAYKDAEADFQADLAARDASLGLTEEATSSNPKEWPGYVWEGRSTDKNYAL